MRTSSYYISTLKEVPSEAELPSHRLMLKAGLIRRVSAGIYIWMPIGWRILQKVETIIREEMNRSGAIELLMPTVQPGELWEESGRWQQYGNELLRFKDRHDKDFCYGPTHEEVITNLVKNEIKSYKQLPVNFYQIQNKFRDEVRPRFGVMRSREFIMKDAYSFHENKASLRETYLKMYDSYNRIFTRLGLVFKSVIADNGSIGGSGSHEYQVIAENGEDTIAYSSSSDYAANVELAPILRQEAKRSLPQSTLTKIATPEVKTIPELVDFLQIDIKKTIKSIVVEAEDDGLVLLLLRGDHVFNEIKVGKLPGIKQPLTFASEEQILQNFSAHGGSLGPVDYRAKVYADYALEFDNDWVVGANEDGYHYTGFNFGRDAIEPNFVDIRGVVEGDPSPDGHGVLKLAKGIEVGHIFELGNKYSQPMKATFLDKSGKTQFFEMGCYGIGVTRIVAAAIEQNHDEKGIIWTKALAPFQVIIVPMNYHKSSDVKLLADKFYQQLSELGIEVLLDDRDERAGVLLNDSELLGIPKRILIGDKGLKENIVEIQQRGLESIDRINIDEAMDFIVKIIEK